MTPLREAVARLRKSGDIVTGPVVLSADSGLDSADILEQALARSFERNQRVLNLYTLFPSEEAPLVMHRPDGKVLKRRQRPK